MTKSLKVFQQQSIHDEEYKNYKFYANTTKLICIKSLNYNLYIINYNKISFSMLNAEIIKSLVK